VNGRKPWVLLLRILVSVGMLLVLFAQVPSFDASELVPEWTAGTIAWLLGAIALTFGAIALSAVRWQQVIHALDMEAPLGRLTSHYFAGQFVSNVLPTTIGGDVLRVSRLTRDTGDGPGSFASVVLERLTGWIVLPLITLTGLALNSGLRELGTSTAVAAGLAGASLIALAVVLWAGSHSRGLGRFTADHGWHRFAGAVHFGLDRMRRHRADTLGVLLAGVTFQLALVMAALFGARALGIDQLGFTAALVFVPAVLIVQVLPVAISGLGVREGAFYLFLRPLDVPHEQAIALGLLLYLLNLVVSLVGAPAFALGGRKELDQETAEHPEEALLFP